MFAIIISIMSITTLFSSQNPYILKIRDKIDETGPPILNKIQKIYDHFPRFVQTGLLHSRYISAASAFFSISNIAFVPVEYIFPELRIFNSIAKTSAFVAATGLTKNEGLGLNIENSHAGGLLRLGVLWLGTSVVPSIVRYNLHTIYNINMTYETHPFSANLIDLVYAPLGAVIFGVAMRFFESEAPKLLNKFVADKTACEEQRKTMQEQERWQAEKLAAQKKVCYE